MMLLLLMPMLLMITMMIMKCGAHGSFSLFAFCVCSYGLYSLFTLYNCFFRGETIGEKAFQTNFFRHWQKVNFTGIHNGVPFIHFRGKDVR